MPELVTVNKFTGDTEEEIAVVLDRCAALGYEAAVVDVWSRGGEGGVEAARKMVEIADAFDGEFTHLYELEESIEEKIRKVSEKVYGAHAIDLTARAKKDIARIESLGLATLPICIAKTQQSLSDNPKLLGRPKDFVVTVREIAVSAGAGFLVPITGEIMRMPGLPRRPAALDIGLDAAGEVRGLA